MKADRLLRVFISHADSDHAEALRQAYEDVWAEFVSQDTDSDSSELWLKFREMSVDYYHLSPNVEILPIDPRSSEAATSNSAKGVSFTNEAFQPAAKVSRLSDSASRPPFNAEYLLFLFVRREERDVVIGDLLECHHRMIHRFGKRRADFWFYKQVAGSLWPLFRRAVVRFGTVVWLGRILRRLISIT
jgi:hypothetical protein